MGQLLAVGRRFDVQITAINCRKLQLAGAVPGGDNSGGRLLGIDRVQQDIINIIITFSRFICRFISFTQKCVAKFLLKSCNSWNEFIFSKKSS